MLLIKCNCGNFTTLDDDFLKRKRNFICPNCENLFEIAQWIEVYRLSQSLKDSGFELYVLPDGTTINFNFNMQK